MALEHRIAAAPDARDGPYRQAERVAIPEAFDLGAEPGAADRFDFDAAADPELPYRADHLDQEPLHRPHATENLDLVNGVDAGKE
jgi:hypothetical protein